MSLEDSYLLDIPIDANFKPFSGISNLTIQPNAPFVKRKSLLGIYYHGPTLEWSKAANLYAFLCEDLFFSDWWFKFDLKVWNEEWLIQLLVLHAFKVGYVCLHRYFRLAFRFQDQMPIFDSIMQANEGK